MQKSETQVYLTSKEVPVRKELEQVFAESPLQIKYWRGHSEKLVVVFSSVGKNPHEYPPVEFFQSATEGKQNHALFISDISRSWLNGDGVSDQVVEVIKRVAKEVSTSGIHLMGNSMGGSMALLIKDQVPAKTVLSFVPQYSVCPDIVPEEKRWMRFRKEIKFFRYPEIILNHTPNQNVFIIHGGSPDELVHARRFPRVRGIGHFILPHQNHNLSQHLKRQGHLDILVSAALNGRKYRFRRLLEQSDGMFIQQFEAMKDV